MLTQTTTTTAADFEAIYAAAGGHVGQVPWAHGRPHPALVAWLNAVAPSLVRCGARVAVVGCGLGDDARELLRRGYEVTAFDWSETAIRWARDRDPADARCFHVADLFELPARWRHRFDLVVEVNTVQSLPPDRRPRMMGAIAELLSPRGYLLVICRGVDEPVALDDGPPWALTEAELHAAGTNAGLVNEGAIAVFRDNEVPPILRMRAVFRRGPAQP